MLVQIIISVKCTQIIQMRNYFGTFAKDFLLDMSPAGRQVHFKAMRKKAAEHPSEQVGKEIRKLYSWNNEEDKLINN
jgi:ketol-acid reductoisomerase